MISELNNKFDEILLFTSSIDDRDVRKVVAKCIGRITMDFDMDLKPLLEKYLGKEVNEILG
jgi:hypothetical protein